MATLRVRDDLGRELLIGRPPSRVVSLVPSDSYSVRALGAGDRLVGQTRFCDPPGADAAPVALVGGTKDVDVAAVLALGPDLVLANQEENTRAALEALAAERVPVLVSLPRRAADGLAPLARLARVLGLAETVVARELLAAGYHGLRAAEAAAVAMAPGADRAPQPRVFVPIWRAPWMTLNADTFGSDLLRLAGADNVFAERLRLYPLAADLGKQAAQDPDGRDQRYPRLELDEVAPRAPDLVLAPDEPYPFGPDELAVLRAHLPGARVVACSGKDLFWSGAWAIGALPRLRALVDAR